MMITDVLGSEDQARGAITRRGREGRAAGVGVDEAPIGQDRLAVLVRDESTRRRFVRGRLARWLLVNLLGRGLLGAAVGALITFVVTVLLGTDRAGVSAAVVAAALVAAGLAIFIAAVMSIGVDPCASAGARRHHGQRDPYVVTSSTFPVSPPPR